MLLAGTAALLVPPVDPVPIVPVKARLNWGATGWPVSVLGIWPVNSEWDVFARAGAYFASVKDDATVTINGSSGKAHDSQSSTEFIGGLGVDAKFMEAWAARFEWLYVPSLGTNSTGTADWNGFQFSVFYKF